MSGRLEAAEKNTFEKHLRQCRQCREQVLQATRLAEEHAQEGKLYWASYVGRQVLGLIAKVPQEIEHLAAAVRAGTVAFVRSGQAVQLAMLQPQLGVLRLAAGSGEEFSEQVLRQEEPPFEFHLAKFGEQLRITIHALGEDPAYRECLARLGLYEGQDCRWSQVVLISAGEGRCNIEPEQARRLRPVKEHLIIKLEPLVTARQLDEAGSGAYIPILERLLQHEDPSIRRGTVQVLGRVGGPSARPLIEPLANDPEQSVRAQAQKTLQQLQLR